MPYVMQTKMLRLSEVRKHVRVKALERGLEVKQIDPGVLAYLEQDVLDSITITLNWYATYGKRRPRLMKYGHKYK